MAKTKDFKTFTRIENPFLPFNRNAVLFPRKVNGNFLINVFDPAAVHERATWEQPAQESEGMDAVFVGGTPAILHGAFTGAANGQVL